MGEEKEFSRADARKMAARLRKSDSWSVDRMRRTGRTLLPACREWLSSPIQKSTTRRQQSVRIAKKRGVQPGMKRRCVKSISSP